MIVQQVFVILPSDRSIASQTASIAGDIDGANQAITDVDYLLMQLAEVPVADTEQISPWASKRDSLPDLAKKTKHPLGKSKGNFPAVCTGYAIPKLCKQYCNVKPKLNCVDSETNRCERFRNKAERKLGSETFPCDVMGEVVVIINAPIESGLPGTTFPFSADTLNADNAADIEWSTADGQTAQGPTAEFTFTESGVVEVEARLGDTTSEIAVLVLGPDGSTPGIPFADLLGDVNEDGAVTLQDAVLAQQAVSRETTLSVAAKVNADVDISGTVDKTDVELISQMVLTGAPSPSAIRDQAALPGAVVQILSPELLEAGQDYTVTVGASTKQNVFAPTPGVGTFTVPFDYITPGTASTSAGTFEVKLFKNGQTVGAFSLEILEFPALPQNPVAELNSIFDRFEEVLALSADATGNLARQSALSELDVQTLTAAGEVAAEDFVLALSELREVLSQDETGSIAAVVLRSMYANGLPEFDQIYSELTGKAAPSSPFRAESQADFQNASGGFDNSLCESTIPAVCEVQQTIKALDFVSGLVSISCDVLIGLTIAAIVLPVDGPVVDAALIGSYAVTCGRLEAALSLASVLNTLITPIDFDLKVETSTNEPSEDEDATITAKVQVFGFDDICALAGKGQSTQIVAEALARRAYYEALRRSTAVRKLRQLGQKVNRDFVKRWDDAVRGKLKDLINNSSLDEAVASLASSVCEVLENSGGVNELGQTVVDANGILKDIEPDEGKLTFNDDGTATYACPTSSSGNSSPSVTLMAEKKFCSQTATQEIMLTCEGKDVMITIGDNGSLNDDIFEVSIDGRTVLTSSSPVRSTSTTERLPLGTTEVTMTGRAAPDGVGTYFIEFSGATVTGGDAQSGSDLTPGTSKRFTLDVE